MRTLIKIIIIIAICTGVFISCNTKTTISQKSLTPSEILSHFIKKKTGQNSADGIYIFICGPYCKGCVQQTLLSLDTTYGDFIKDKDWTFFTSHDFVMKYPLKNIKFKFDAEWEKVNYKFEDVVLIKFSNDSIIYSEKINNIDRDSLIKYVTE